MSTSRDERPAARRAQQHADDWSRCTLAWIGLARRPAARARRRASCDPVAPVGIDLRPRRPACRRRRGYRSGYSIERHDRERAPASPTDCAVIVPRPATVLIPFSCASPPFAAIALSSSVLRSRPLRCVAAPAPTIRGRLDRAAGAAALRRRSGDDRSSSDARNHLELVEAGAGQLLDERRGVADQDDRQPIGVQVVRAPRAARRPRVTALTRSR